MVYKLSCCGNSTYVGQTVRNEALRIEEHEKEGSPLGIDIHQCGEEAASAQLSWKMKEEAKNALKLLTLGALHCTLGN